MKTEGWNMKTEGWKMKTEGWKMREGKKVTEVRKTKEDEDERTKGRKETYPFGMEGAKSGRKMKKEERTMTE